MPTFTREVVCPVCKTRGVGIYDEQSGLLQSYSCAGGCWSTSAGKGLIDLLNAARS